MSENISIEIIIQYDIKVGLLRVVIIIRALIYQTILTHNKPGAFLFK